MFPARNSPYHDFFKHFYSMKLLSFLSEWRARKEDKCLFPWSGLVHIDNFYSKSKCFHTDQGKQIRRRLPFDYFPCNGSQKICRKLLLSLSSSTLILLIHILSCLLILSVQHRSVRTHHHIIKYAHTFYYNEN